jgi:hypothetical protein
VPVEASRRLVVSGRLVLEVGAGCVTQASRGVGVGLSLLQCGVARPVTGWDQTLQYPRIQPASKSRRQCQRCTTPSWARCYPGTLNVGEAHKTIPRTSEGTEIHGSTFVCILIGHTGSRTVAGRQLGVRAANREADRPARRLRRVEGAANGGRCGEARLRSRNGTTNLAKLTSSQVASSEMPPNG